VSVGVAVFPTHGTELAELLREADAALYRAKGAGRNRVMLAERGRGTPSAQPVLQT
jgi:diguanylate cyclase (GGDEF)-like protein